MADVCAELMLMRPIGCMRSVFQFKNGTPRQPALCGAALGSLTVDKNIFNNPEHALEGLQQFSHAWIIFVFHKNRPGHTKAKVKPPRLNGRRVGVFSTRSPYRPNAIGLTLAKIERITGATVHFSGIDIIDGTPVLDIKPFIPQYDVPACQGESFITDNCSAGTSERCTINDDNDTLAAVLTDFKAVSSSFQDSALHCSISSHVALDKELAENTSTGRHEVNCSATWINDGGIGGDSITNIEDSTRQCDYAQPSCPNSCSHSVSGEPVFVGPTNGENKAITSSDSSGMQGSEQNISIRPGIDQQGCVQNGGNCCGTVEDIVSSTEQKRTLGASQLHTKHGDPFSSNTTVAEWLDAPPITKLRVSFTPTAYAQLQKFRSRKSVNNGSHYRLEFLTGLEEVHAAIVSVLAEDPRSVYRREKCSDSLYFFTVDQVHVTCWFDDKENRVEVVRLQPVSFAEKLVKVA